MTAIKTEIKKLIDRQDDVEVLNAIRTLLQKASGESVLKEKLTARALKSEENIKSGKVFSRSEVEKQTDRMFRK